VRGICLTQLAHRVSAQAKLWHGIGDAMTSGGAMKYRNYSIRSMYGMSTSGECDWYDCCWLQLTVLLVIIGEEIAWRMLKRY